MPTDKQLHFFVGFVLSDLCYAVGGSVGSAFWVVAAVALLKEARDYITKRGTPEIADFLATMLGWTCWSLLTTLVTKI
jgi:hypothetical protein